MRGTKTAKLLVAGLGVAGSVLAGSALAIGGGLPIGGSGGIEQLTQLLGGGSSITGGAPLASGITDNLNYPVNLDCLEGIQVHSHPMIPAGSGKEAAVPDQGASLPCGQNGGQNGGTGDTQGGSTGPGQVPATPPRCASGPGIHPMYCVA